VRWISAAEGPEGVGGGLGASGGQHCVPIAHGDSLDLLVVEEGFIVVTMEGQLIEITASTMRWVREGEARTKVRDSSSQ